MRNPHLPGRLQDLGERLAERGRQEALTGRTLHSREQIEALADHLGDMRGMAAFYEVPMAGEIECARTEVEDWLRGGGRMSPEAQERIGRRLLSVGHRLRDLLDASTRGTGAHGPADHGGHRA